VTEFVDPPQVEGPVPLQASEGNKGGERLDHRRRSDGGAVPVGRDDPSTAGQGGERIGQFQAALAVIAATVTVNTTLRHGLQTPHAAPSVPLQPAQAAAAASARVARSNNSCHAAKGHAPVSSSNSSSSFRAAAADTWTRSRCCQ
jgi:hypothetical protein